jgi:hypothetical protein
MGPVLADELNAHWAAARLPFRLARRGVAQLWAVYPAGQEALQPLLFIIGDEARAVRQAQHWATTGTAGDAAAVAA